jgi:hypothetical protein
MTAAYTPCNNGEANGVHRKNSVEVSFISKANGTRGQGFARRAGKLVHEKVPAANGK